MAQSRTVKVLALSAGQGLAVLVGLIATAILARVLTIRDYATYRQTFLAYQFAAPLLTLGLPTALYYFLPGENQRRRGVLFDNLVALTIMGFIFAVFLLAGGNRLLALRFTNPDLAGPLRWMALYAVFTLPAGAIGACLTVQNRVMQLSIFNVISRTLILAAIILVALVWADPYTAVKVNVICEGFVLAAALWLMIRAVPHDDARVSLQGIFAMAKYAVPLGFASMLGALTLQLDKMIVAAMCSPEEFAVYANGAMEIPFIGIITGSIAAVILADMRTAIAGNDHQQALQLFHTAALKASCLLFPVACFLMVFAPDVITLVFSAKYRGSIVPFRLYLLILPVRIVFYGSALMALGLTRVVLIRSVAELILNAGLCVIAVRLFGPLGAVVATIATVYLWSVPYNWFHISREFKVSFWHTLPLARIGGVLLAAVAAGAMSSTLLMIDFALPGSRLLVGGICFAATYIGFGVLLKTEIRGTVSLCKQRLVAFRSNRRGAAGSQIPV
jgi:O-antigen/teichoic acid export membrane protein